MLSQMFKDDLMTTLQTLLILKKIHKKEARLSELQGTYKSFQFKSFSA